MPIKNYDYSVEGVGGNGGSFKVSGPVQSDLAKITEKILMATFEALTEGHAEYGKAGPCGGPYSITRIVIELKNRNRTEPK